MTKLFEIVFGLTGRRWVIPALSLLALPLAYTGIWIYVATQSVSTAERWVADRRAEGYSIHYEGLEATGYPFWIRIDLISPGIAAATGAVVRDWAGASWKAENLTITTRPWRPDQVWLRTTGRQSVSYLEGDERLEFAGPAAIGTAVSFSGGRVDAVNLNIDGLDLVPQQEKGGMISIINAVIDGRALHDADSEASLSLDVVASGVEMPAALVSPLGQDIRDLRLVARLLGELPRGAGVSLTEALQIWRDNGGTIEVEKLSLGHGPLNVSGDGTLALDRDLQPVGAFTARVQGFFDSIDALARQGVIDARQAISAKLILGVLSRRPAGGGPATLNLAITVQQQNLYAGPVKLFRLPRVQWH